jgi:predicted regulator of Ras-like GTPase activity (Roadblock/LC7/MglB family)
MVQDVSEVKRSLDWLVTDFTERVADVAHAVVVSSDGVPVAVSNDIPAGHAQQLCAITSGLTGLADGAARLSGGGMVIQALIEMERGLMVVKAVSGGSSLAVLAAPECDPDLVAYEMTLLAEAVGDILTPATRT